MFEGVLYFALGFLAAALLALMVAPAIWRRAVLLTRRRIEGSVPLTLNEIQADKDQLRAEFAMSTRRLEMSVEKLREKAAEQLVQINRNRGELTDLNDETQQKSQDLSHLEAQGSEMRSQLRQSEESLADAKSRLISAESQLEQRAADIDNLEQQFRSALDQSDGQRIELAARDTQMQNLADKVTDLNKVRIKGRKDSSQLKSEIKTLKREATKEKRRASDLDKRLARLQTTLADREEKLERRERELAKSRDRSKEVSSSNSATEAELARVREEKVDIEAKLAKSSLRIETLLDEASNQNEKKAVLQAKKDKLGLVKSLKEVTNQRDVVKAKLSAMQIASGDDWDIERRENAVLRERINDLAAQVTAMTALLEGDDSIINDILAREAKKPVKSAGKPAKTGKVTSLAERIRALQLAASD